MKGQSPVDRLLKVCEGKKVLCITRYQCGCGLTELFRFQCMNLSFCNAYKIKYQDRLYKFMCIIKTHKMPNHELFSFSFLPPNPLSCKGRIARLTRVQTLIPLTSITLLLLRVHELPFRPAQSEAFIRAGRGYFPTHLTHQHQMNALIH